MSHVLVNLSGNDLKRLDALAEGSGGTRESVVQDALAEYLDQPAAAWPLEMEPADYIARHEDDENPSARVAKHLALARTLTEKG